MILDNYDHQTGKSCRTIALRNLMARNGLEWKEDFVFGLGGGLNFSFVLPGKNIESRFFKALSPNLFQLENFAENMNLEYQVITKANDGFDFMENVLRYEDNPVLCEVNPGVYKKEISGENSRFWDEIQMEGPLTSHITEVVGIDKDKVYFCENYSKDMFSVTKEIFAKARNLNKDTYLNAHHKIHYYVLPDSFAELQMSDVLKIAIKRNLNSYCDNPNERLGKRAFEHFMESIPDCYERYSKKLCERSLKITGSLIKYVSPGMFRKIYARFLDEAGRYLKQEEEFTRISGLFKSSDFMWNKLGSIFLNQEKSVYERLNGEKTKDLLGKIRSAEYEAVQRMLEVSSLW